MKTFASTWVNGKTDNVDDLIKRHPDRTFMYVLDTNFCIYARDFCQNKDDFNKTHPHVAKDFFDTANFIRNNPRRTIYQYGCEEASRTKRTGNIDEPKYKLMVECLNKVLNTNFPNELLSAQLTTNKSDASSKVPLLKNNGLFKLTTTFTYVTLLKAFIIKKIERINDKEDALFKFIHYLAEDLDTVSPMAISFGFHYFSNESNILRGININNEPSKIFDKLYAAAIDLSLPTICAQLSETTFYREIPLFITFDKGIKLIFDSLVIIGKTECFDDVCIPSYEFKVFYSSGWTAPNIRKAGEKIRQIIEARKIDCYKRNRNTKYEHALKTIKNLENELEQYCVDRLMQ
jgi:hypothetical protein